MKNYIIFFWLTSFSIIFAQKSYYVTKNSNGNFSSIKEINANMKYFSSGDKILFHTGEVFDDAPLLITQSGSLNNPIVFGSYGNESKPVIGNKTTTFKNVISIKANYITIENLKIFGNSYSASPKRWHIYVRGNYFTIRNCTMIGGDKSRETSNTYMLFISANKYKVYEHIKILNNEISKVFCAIHVGNPYNVEISYNTIHDNYYYYGRSSVGGSGIEFSSERKDKKIWHANYTVLISHNEFYKYEHSAIHATAYGFIIEYNNIHDPLDDRLYFGGMKHGGLGKVFDVNRGYEKIDPAGKGGHIIRYNYIHDIKIKGKVGYLYGRPTPVLLDSDNPQPIILSKNTGDIIHPAYDGASDRKTNVKNTYDKAGDTDYAPDAIISGLGYANLWIHNNIFYNITHDIFERSWNRIGGPSGKLAPFKNNFPSYFLNNTLIDVGLNNYRDSEYPTFYEGAIHISSDCGSPNFIMNNIIDYANTNNRRAITVGSKKCTIRNNLYTNKSGYAIGGDQGKSDNKAVWFKIKDILPVGEIYNTNPHFKNPNKKIFVKLIGPKGTYIPDFRLSSKSKAINNGTDYLNDPTGVSTSIDILGQIRETTDIGACGIGESSSEKTPELPTLPTITQQPINQSSDLGKSIKLTVKAECKDPISYQWWKSPFVSVKESKIIDGNKYSGATTNTLTIKNIESSDNKTKYLCEVYNPKDHKNYWVNSQPAIITVTSSKKNFSSNTNSDLKVYLEGAFQNGKMLTTLLENNYLPKSQPFNNSIYNYTAFQKVNNFPNTIVDWVLIELRATLTKKVKRFTALLKDDGTILNLDASKNFTNLNIPDGNYYLVIYHRNHLPIMSSSKISVKNSVMTYDFTIALNKAYGANSMTKLKNGKFAMYAGDTDGNRIINDNDYKVIKNNIFSSGYVNGDTDMNGIVNVLDYSKINKNLNIKSNVP